jgi:hypothetical protein
MGGECNATIVYGFMVKDTYVKLLGGGENICIGSNRIHGLPIYYCTDLQHIYKRDIDVLEIHDLISKLDEKELKIIGEFDIFAKKYRYTPSWQVCCVGDFAISMSDSTKENVIERFIKWKNDILKNNEIIYKKDGSYNNDAKDTIEIILLEEYMGFMIENAYKTKNIDEIITMIDEYYSLK